MNVSLPTVVIDLDIGPRVLKLEQLADLDVIVREAIVEKLPNPYWAYLWPSAIALAKAIGTGPALDGLRVLDLGCGLGALGIAAAARGADVVCADICAEAVELASRNAASNGLSVGTAVFDWTKPPPDLGTFDHILAADVFYEDGMLAGVARFLRGHLAPEGAAYIADPMRIAPGGIAGAVMLHGLTASSTTLSEGQVMTGGVMLHEIKRRPRRGA